MSNEAFNKLKEFRYTNCEGRAEVLIVVRCREEQTSGTVLVLLLLSSTGKLQVTSHYKLTGKGTIRARLRES